MKTILVINGPNLSLLGTREPDIYGHETLAGINDELDSLANELGLGLIFFQSNVEGEIINKIIACRTDVAGLIINAGAYTHTSIAIADCIKATGIMAVEVHLSNIYARETERHTSMMSAACIGQISGFGADSYLLALRALVDRL